MSFIGSTPNLQQLGIPPQSICFLKVCVKKKSKTFQQHILQHIHFPPTLESLCLPHSSQLLHKIISHHQTQLHSQKLINPSYERLKTHTHTIVGKKKEMKNLENGNTIHFENHCISKISQPWNHYKILRYASEFDLMIEFHQYHIISI